MAVSTKHLPLSYFHMRSWPVLWVLQLLFCDSFLQNSWTHHTSCDFPESVTAHTFLSSPWASSKISLDTQWLISESESWPSVYRAPLPGQSSGLLWGPVDWSQCESWLWGELFPPPKFLLSGIIFLFLFLSLLTNFPLLQFHIINYLHWSFCSNACTLH